MDKVVQIIVALFGTLGFCLAFHVEKRHIFVPVAGGALCWAAYLIFQHFGLDTFWSTFLSCALIGIYAEISAYLLKMTTTVVYITSCVPLIPGSNLYYAMSALFSKNYAECRRNLILLVLFMAGIVVGFCLIQELDHVRRAIMEKRRKMEMEGPEK